MFSAVILYAVFGGADFGSGVWDLTAGDARRGAATRRLVDHAIGPVWEANHVWLIFVLVFLWTGFPEPFAELMTELAIPFWLAGLGIVARGAGFAFRKFSPTLRWAQVGGVIFATASLITPFFLGTIAGAIASGRVTSNGSTTATWLGPTAILGGVLAVATCTFLAGVFMCAEAEATSQSELADELRRKSLVGGAVTGAIVLAGIPVVLTDAEVLADGLLGRAAPLVVLSAVGGAATFALLWRRRFRLARITGAVAVAAVVAGWGVAQYPWILVNEVTIEDGAGSRATLVGLLVAAGIAAVLVVPPLMYLLALSNAGRFHDHDEPAST
jgi:cytochrome d ubiquinol oxidase subunit II